MARKQRPKEQLALPTGSVSDASLVDEARRRYLNYALSVITSRALPDVRDGMKPVQRRILYTMQNELRLRHDAKPRKSAAIVGDVMGKFHPHGDNSIYDALVRMAQSFSMRAPLVDGRGNFGSPDGDSAAAMRYTEAKLAKLAEELMAELGQKTVPFRPNYDGTRFEPVVLPARFPNLLVNGAQGIAVGMATSIPPHNLGEVVDACIALIDDPETSLSKLQKHVRGPDFPTGGELVATKKELADIYETGQGSLKLRGTWHVEAEDKKQKSRGNTQVIITSIPYSVERATIVARIADVIIAKKLPVLLDVRDESTDDCRVVLEVKQGADPQLVMAYLHKHTPLTTNVQVNLTCLVPLANPELAAPQRLDLKSMLRHFLDFRMDVVQKRLAFDLEQLLRRIHILEGFEKVFDALDETIRIIRRSEGKQDAANKIIKRFGLDEEQVDAILELKLYRLAKLEILVIQQELEQKRTEAKRLEKLLKSATERWKLIRAEMHALKETYQDPRRTRILSDSAEPTFDAEAFIVDEDAMVVLSAQGWIKRQQRVRDVSATRTRDGDSVFEVIAGSTRSAVAFFSNLGACYVTRIVDVPATTGYGVPVQTLFKMADGERIVAMMGFDPRFFEVPAATEGSETPEAPFAVAVTKQGMCMRFSLRAHRDPSTRAGRKYMRPAAGDEVVFVGFCEDDDHIACATAEGRALICEVSEVSVLSGPGKGVMLIKLSDDDAVVGANVLGEPDDALIVESESGKQFEVSTKKYEVVSRAGKGFQLLKRGAIEKVVWGEPTLPGFPVPGEEN